MTYIDLKIKELKERIDRLPPEVKSKIMNRLYEITGWDLLLYSPAFFEKRTGIEGILQDIGYARITRNLENKLNQLERLVSCIEKTADLNKCEGTYPSSSIEGFLQELFTKENLLLLVLFGILLLLPVFKGGK